jgi:glycosyltransferase involved in cell wall biosynthesis
MGGIETHILTLATYLLQQGYVVEVWFIRRHSGNPLHALLDQQKIPYHFAASLSDYWRQLRQQKQQIILHTHGYKGGIIGRIFAKLLSIPVVSTYHSGDLGSGKLKLYSMVDLMTARLGRCIAVSEPIKANLPDSTEVISNFVEVPATPPARPAPSDKPLRVAFVGRLSHEKGPDQFCQLAALWHQKGQLEFVIYGDGPDRHSLSKEYPQQVAFKGHVKMTNHWHEVDVLCISSRYEGLPYVALEAMALGIPVVSFAVGGIGALISDTSLGWLVEAGNIGKLSEALVQWHALSTEDKAQLAIRVQDKIRKNYSSAALVPKIESIYRQCSALR